MNIHKLDAPKRLPEVRITRGHSGARAIRSCSAASIFSRRMEWDCKVCGFEKVTCAIGRERSAMKMDVAKVL